MMGYARARGLPRRLIAVPVLTPRLSSYWVHFVTPIPSTIAGPLIEGLSSEVVVHGDLAAQLFPDIHPMSYQEPSGGPSTASITGRSRPRGATRWRAARGPGAGHPDVGGRDDLERRQRHVAAPPKTDFAAFSSLGGERGWRYAEGSGGCGAPWTGWSAASGCAAAGVTRTTCEPATRSTSGVSRRSCRGPAASAGGDEGAGQRLAAVRGQAARRARTLLVQTAFFAPKGLGGCVLVRSLPVHRAIFSGMIRRLAEQAEEELAAAGIGGRPADPPVAGVGRLKGDVTSPGLAWRQRPPALAPGRRRAR